MVNSVGVELPQPRRPGRPETPVNPDAGPVEQFATELRQLRRQAGERTYMALARRSGVSASALSEATRGVRLPTWPVVRAFVTACGQDAQTWHERWLAVRAQSEDRDIVGSPAQNPARHAGGMAALDAEPYAGQPWPAQPITDGSDPEQAGCGPDAVTADAIRVALIEQRIIVGRLQLRYSRHKQAAWSRFEGFHSLDEMARRRRVEIEVLIERAAAGVQLSARMDYSFDYHWSDVLLTRMGPIAAGVRIYVDGSLVAEQNTDAHSWTSAER